MGAARNKLQWGKLLWTHLWIDHMYFFAKKWRILSKISSFAMGWSHRRLKRMLRNSGGLSLLRGRLWVQVAVDNPTTDDSLVAHGGYATKGHKMAKDALVYNARGGGGGGPLGSRRQLPPPPPELTVGRRPLGGGGGFREGRLGGGGSGGAIWGVGGRGGHRLPLPPLAPPLTIPSPQT